MHLEATRDLLHLFGDETRVRLVALLARHELTVADLTTVTQCPQSRVSTHLGKLREAGVVRDRRNGASTFYAINDGSMPPAARTLWTLLEGQLDDAVVTADRARAEAIVRARERGASWPDAVAGEMERHYSPGRTWEATARAFLGLVRVGDVLDIGAGDGTIAQLLAPRCRAITCLDQSARMAAAARARLASQHNVRVVEGDAHAVPAPDASFDHVLLLNVLAAVERPADVLAEAARVLRPGGGLTLVTLDAHRHGKVAASYGHLHAGFRPATLKKWLLATGLAVEHCAVSSRERRPPHFSVVSAFASKPIRRSPHAQRRH